MRAFDIALIIALFTGVGGVIDDIGILGSYEAPMSLNTYTDEDFSKIDGEVIVSDPALIRTDNMIGSTTVLSAIGKLGDYVLIRTVIMNVFATNLIYDSVEYNQIRNIANLIQIGCAFVYMFAILQLWRKVSTKHME